VLRCILQCILSRWMIANHKRKSGSQGSRGKLLPTLMLAMLYSTVQYGTVQYLTVQYCSLQVTSTEGDLSVKVLTA